MDLSDWERVFIAQQRVARLATVDKRGQPHVVPIVYAFDGARLFTPIDAKPKRVDPHRLQRVRNIQANPRAAVIIDQYHEDWHKLAWVQLRGRAVLVETGSAQATGVALLKARYSQYATMPLAGRPLIMVQVDHVTGWRAAS